MTFRTLCLALLLFGLTPWPGTVALSHAETPSTAVYLLWRQGCPHCERAIEHLRRLEAADSQLRVHYLEVGTDSRNQALLADLVMYFGIDRVAVPFILVGERVFVGYLDDSSTGRDIEAAIQACRAAPCPDIAGSRIAALQAASGAGERAAPADAPPARTHPSLPGGMDSGASPTSVPTLIRLPLIGDIDSRNLSLFALTLVLAAADGFNPCAMWTLVFLIGLLAGMADRTRMWILGSAFVAASAAVYFLFMAAWLNTLLLLGMIIWIRIAVGLVALGGGAYYLFQGMSRADPVCTVTAPAARRRVLETLRALTLEKRFMLALGGIIALAFAVNLVELICSAGIPAVYTQVLALTPMPRWQYYAYLLLYITVFMLDDIVVFVAAMSALSAAGVGTRYTRWSNLIGGAVLLGLGVLLLVRPGLLVLG